jgi:hypothetical protein
MKKLFIPVAAALTVVVSTTAFGESTTHTIKYMDAKKGTMTLMDGNVYMLATKELTSHYEVGDRVLVTFTISNGVNHASKVERYRVRAHHPQPSK